jgi:regulator of replication initiation timing
MFNGKKIKQLEERVAALNERVQTLAVEVDFFAKRVEAQSAEIDKLYMKLAQKEVSKPLPVKPKPNRKPKKNGKENTEAAK